MAPVAGSVGAVPETKTSPAALTPWLYVGGGLAAFGVKTISRAISPPAGCCDEPRARRAATASHYVQDLARVTPCRPAREMAWLTSRSRSVPGAVPRSPRRV